MSERTCHCGHVEDEHGGDPQYPGSTACQIEDCGCIAFEHDPQAQDRGGEPHGE
jgi:hypothetical protein